MRVLISGAGIAGSTIAFLLAKTGARITVLEKSRSILPHGQNVDIEGSGITAIKNMGLLEPIRQANTTEKGNQFIDPNGKPFAKLLQSTSSASATSETEILRGDLARILYEAADAHRNVTYKFDTIITKVISNDDEMVKVELSNGDIQEFDYLVAADGQWSKVRKQCFAPESVKVVDKGMYAVYWTIPRISSDNDLWNLFLAGKRRTISLRPDPYGTIRAMFSYMPSNDTQKKEWETAARSDKKIREDLLRREFADAGWQAPRLLESMAEAPDFYFQQIQQIRMNKWSKSRVVCVGDAAYAPTPLTGSGTTLAITGAYILAGELSKLQESENPSKAFEGYEKTFRPFVEKIQDLPFFVPGIVHPSSDLGRWLFNTFMWAIAKILNNSWVAKNRKGHKSGESNDDGFPLPRYPTLEAKLFSKE